MGLTKRMFEEIMERESEENQEGFAPELIPEPATEDQINLIEQKLEMVRLSEREEIEIRGSMAFGLNHQTASEVIDRLTEYQREQEIYPSQKDIAKRVERKVNMPNT